MSAINPILPLVSPNVTATNGSNQITVTGSVDCSKVVLGTLVYIGDLQPVIAESGTNYDPGTGESTITLYANWTDTTTTAPMLAAWTYEGLAQVSSRLRSLIEGVDNAEITYDNLAQQLQDDLTLIGDAPQYATEAKNWVITAVDTLVPDGNGTDEYSALHYWTKTQTMYTQVETWHTQVGNWYTSFNADLTQFNTDYDTFNTAKTDFDTKKGQFDTDYASFQGSYSSFVSAKAGFDTDYGQFDTDYGAFNAAKTDFDTKKDQFDTDLGQFNSDLNQFNTDYTDFTTTQLPLALQYRDEARTARDEAQQAAQSLTGGMYFGGPWDASGGSAPPTPSDGSAFYKITVAGVIGGADYAVGDNIVYDNVGASWFKIDNTESVTLWSQIQGKPTEFPPEPHSHSISDVSSLQSKLDEIELFALAGL